jgi:thiamine phosphate synthase YjbQ (UPF0047 family)
MAGSVTHWFQTEICLNSMKKGCHLITDQIEKLTEPKKIKIGLCNILGLYIVFYSAVF